MRAPNTNRMQDSIHISMAVRPRNIKILGSSFTSKVRHTFSLRSVGGDCIEDVDEYKEESDEQSHSARNDIRRNNKTDPGHDNKQTCDQRRGDFESLEK